MQYIYREGDGNVVAAPQNITTALKSSGHRSAVIDQASTVHQAR